MAEKEHSSEEVEAFKRELEEIKTDRLRKELEEIKNERMRRELDELKKEKAAEAGARPKQPALATSRHGLSLSNLAAAAVMLLIAGYLLGTVYGTDIAGDINSHIQGYSLPFGGDAIVAALAIVLAAFGIAIMTIVRK